MGECSPTVHVVYRFYFKSMGEFSLSVREESSIEVYSGGYKWRKGEDKKILCAEFLNYSMCIYSKSNRNDNTTAK